MFYKSVTFAPETQIGKTFKQSAKIEEKAYKFNYLLGTFKSTKNLQKLANQVKLLVEITF